MHNDLDIPSHGERLGAWHFPPQTDDLASGSGRPCVVMGHGFGATRDCGLTPFAERFSNAGADVVIFDYRGFGTSSGEARQSVDHLKHRQDYAAAVAHARTLPGVDPDRIVLWGSSYSGGHVLAVAARDPRIAGVISQAAGTDGIAAVRHLVKYAGPRQMLRLNVHALRDVGRMITRREPHLIPIVGEPGSVAVVTSHDGLEGYQGIAGPTFRNEMRARGVLPILFNRPVTQARKLHMPVLLVIASEDSIAPPSAVEAVARNVRGRVEVERLPYKHFDIYHGEAFEKSVAAQVAFLTSL
jgi:hypothetical protein